MAEDKGGPYGLCARSARHRAMLHLGRRLCADESALLHDRRATFRATRAIASACVAIERNRVTNRVVAMGLKHRMFAAAFTAISAVHADRWLRFLAQGCG